MSEAHYHPSAPIQDGVQHGPYQDKDPLGQLNRHYIEISKAHQAGEVNNRAAAQLKAENIQAANEYIGSHDTQPDD